MGMAALRSRLVLHERGRKLVEQEANLDHRDPQATRAALEQMVRNAKGTLHLDLSRFWLDVRKTNGVQRCEVRVTPSGSTTVRRLAAF